jgi:hypothetical protein
VASHDVSAHNGLSVYEPESWLPLFYRPSRLATLTRMMMALRRKTGGGCATRALGSKKDPHASSKSVRFERTPWPLYNALSSGNGYFAKTCRRIASEFASIVPNWTRGPSCRRDGKYQPAANVLA